MSTGSLQVQYAHLPCVKGEPCPSAGDGGTVGPAGPPGPPGIQGLQGDQGLQGPAGSPGAAGATGSQGPKGDTGDAGAPGAQGIPGNTGSAGPKGDTGSQGPTGNTGSQGPSGADGAQGIQGSPGNNAPSYQALADGTTAMAFASYATRKVTPTATATLTTTVPVAGTVCHLLVLTSGTTSRTLTFGTGFKSIGTLATGTTAARVFVIHWISDGTNLYEAGRTAAMVA